MRIQDFSLPTFYAALPATYGREERTADFLQAVQQGNWCEVRKLLKKGHIDPMEKDKVLLHAADSESEALALDLVRIARSHGPLPARVDSQILLSAVERGFINLVSEQLDSGLIQPWAADASLKAAAERTYPDITYLLLQTNFCSKKGKEEAVPLRCSHSFF